MDALEKISQETQIPEHEIKQALDVVMRAAWKLSLTPRVAVDYLLSSCEGGHARILPDARAADWCARLRILDAGRRLVADTDDDLPEDAPGADVVRGLPALASWAAGIVHGFAPALQRGALEALFASRLPSLRTALGRDKTGHATWAVPFQVEEAVMTARIDVARVADAPGVTRRSASRPAPLTGAHARL